MRRFLTVALARLARDDGFTIIELLAATVVLAVGIVGLFEALIVATHATQTNRVRQAETSLGRELIEDTRSLAYTQLTPAGIASALQSAVQGATASGSTLTVQRAISGAQPSTSYSFTATFTACSLDDPADGTGDHTQAPASGGSWCLDNPSGPSSPPDTTPDDYKRVSVTISPTGNITTPTVQQTALIYARDAHGPAVSCLSTTTTCPGSNQTETTGTSQTFYVTTTAPATSIQWLVNGSPPPAGQVPGGSVDPYAPGGTSSTFVWNFPTVNVNGTQMTVDGTYTISAVAFDANGHSGTIGTLAITVNEHDAIAPATINAGWNNKINGVDIQWVPSVDQDVVSYNVYAQTGTGSPVKVCDQIKGLSCHDLTATAPVELPLCPSTSTATATSNTYWVVGVDTAPNGQLRESSQQSPKVDANLCDHPPNAPTLLSSSGLSGGAMTLNWSAPSPLDPDSWDTIQAYRIYRWSGTGPSFPGSRLELVGGLNGSQPVTTYTDSSADPGGVAQNYCVTAVDTHLNESDCSATVTG